MSRHWSQREYINADALWEFLDNHNSRLSIAMQLDSTKSSELCKLLLFGRQEMLDILSEYLHEQQAPLGDIITERYDILTKDELDNKIKDYYGVDR
jgi:hypothetical protein